MGAVLAALAILWTSAALAGTNVAVFNFQMKSETADWRWLEKGLADRIATDFVQSRGLSVVAAGPVPGILRAPSLARSGSLSGSVVSGWQFVTEL
jgi:hypothetical protein